MAEHTPIPWHIDPDPRVHGADQVCEANGDAVAFIATGRDAEEHEANGAFIVRACNSHAALLEACHDLLDIDTHAESDERARVTAQARAALALALRKD